MAFDQNTRNKLQRFVSNARTLLTEEFTRQLQEDYGIDPATGQVTPLDRLTHLDDGRRETARMLRETLDHYRAVAPSGNTNEVLDRIIREQAFTVLNRLCAVQMAEARGIIIETIANGYNSKGFQLFSQLARTALGEVGDAYRSYLFSVFDEFAVDLPVLFDRYSPLGRLFPKPEKLISGNPSKPGLIEMMNSEEIAPLWAEDETIGWIYQYFNSAEERRQMRKESSAPRNSRELAVRNQFFTPRYVVEFLTDNTLGRIWYEMTKGETALKETCRYLVRRPMEIFLAEGEEAPEEERPSDDLSQEELLKQPVYIPHRPLKDPREILLLDPACGSMHFGLYAFDLFEKIYKEAWELEEQHGKDALFRSKDLKPLRETYSTKEDLLRDVPRLIIEYNIHGIDIDPRAVQIAGLSLWLRAQRSWKEQATDPAKRPQIRRSNVVCAEPMPGEKEFLEEFIETHLSAGPELKLLGQIVRRVFDAMKLAGEAGSLLKIEEEISEFVTEAKKKWQSKPQHSFSFEDIPTYLQEGFDLDVSRITDEAFWDKAEEYIYAALQKYAEEAENGDGYQRRLFAEDAARGFAFIAVCRKRYDVVVMNPPFGEFPKNWKKRARKVYPNSYRDILGAFIDSFLHRLNHYGRLGAITSRTCFFLNSFRKWRNKVILKDGFLSILVDLGIGVMDDAMVETAAYVVERKLDSKFTKALTAQSNTICFRLLKERNKQAALMEALMGKNLQNVFVVDLKSFALTPNNTFTYWVAHSTLQKLFEFAPLEGTLATIKVGLQTGDDWRFLRQWWEVSPRLIGPQNINDKKMTSIYETSQILERQMSEGREWLFYSKTDYAAPWYSPLFQVVNWKKGGVQYEHFLDSEGKTRARVQNREFYLQSGFSYMLRSFRLVPYIVPYGVIPTAGRAQVFSINDSIAPALIICACNIGSAVARFSGEMFARPKFQASMVQSIPAAILKKELIAELFQYIVGEIKKRRLVFQGYEPCIEYVRPIWLEEKRNTLTWRRETLLGESLERKVAAAYGLDEYELKQLERDIIESIESQSYNPSNNHEFIDEIENYANVIDESRNSEAEGLISYLIGVTFGRWDIRYATGEKQPPELPDPFAPLPVCPPGMLQNEQGLPARPEDVPADYPVDIPWDGIIVDDPGHPLDIERRVREVIEIIWKERAEDIEHEACEILGVKSLREYFSKSTGFFADHLKRYSKSRRQAPIYWPLSTASGSYTLWVYYHRLTDQTLYTCVNDFVEPKLRQVTESSNELRRKKSRSNQEEKELERLSDLEVELKEFRDELLRVARLWKPNLNDGVQITAAPLWKLFRFAKWQNSLKDTWERLERGEYDWAHLAFSIWPDRVVRLAQKDRSIAIAHDLEDELWEEIVESGRQKGSKRKWVPKKLAEAELRKIVQEKTG